MDVGAESFLTSLLSVSPPEKGRTAPLGLVFFKSQVGDIIGLSGIMCFFLGQVASPGRRVIPQGSHLWGWESSEREYQHRSIMSGIPSDFSLLKTICHDLCWASFLHHLIYLHNHPHKVATIHRRGSRDPVSLRNLLLSFSWWVKEPRFKLIFAWHQNMFPTLYDIVSLT